MSTSPPGSWNGGAAKRTIVGVKNDWNAVLKEGPL